MLHRLRLRRRLTGDRRGITSIEFGLLAAPLTMFMFGVIEVSMAIRMQSALQYATSRAARCASVDAVLCATTADIQTYATTQTMGVVVDSSAFTVSTTDCGKKVTASVPFPIVAHSVLPNAFNLTAQSCYPL